MANSKEAEKRIPGEVAGFSMVEAPKISLPKGGGEFGGLAKNLPPTRSPARAQSLYRLRPAQAAPVLVRVWP